MKGYKRKTPKGRSIKNAKIRGKIKLDKILLFYAYQVVTTDSILPVWKIFKENKGILETAEGSLLGEKKIGAYIKLNFVKVSF